MKITVNGQDKELTPDATLQSAIKGLSPNCQNVIAELNGSIVQQDQWDTTVLQDGDALELVTFVGGG